MVWNTPPHNLKEETSLNKFKSEFQKVYYPHQLDN